MQRPDDDPVVEMSDHEAVLPETARDDTDAGWGERSPDNDERLREERPPHWD